MARVRDLGILQLFWIVCPMVAGIVGPLDLALLGMENFDFSLPDPAEPVAKSSYGYGEIGYEDPYPPPSYGHSYHDSGYESSYEPSYSHQKSYPPPSYEPSYPPPSYEPSYPPPSYSPPSYEPSYPPPSYSPSYPPPSYEPSYPPPSYSPPSYEPSYPPPSYEPSYPPPSYEPSYPPPSYEPSYPPPSYEPSYPPPSYHPPPPKPHGYPPKVVVKKVSVKEKVYVPVTVQRKKKKMKIITIQKGFYIPGGTQLFGKYKNLKSCEKACAATPNCFAGDYNPWLKKCYIHSNFTACATVRAHKKLIHFKKVPCDFPEAPEGRVMLGVQIHKGVEQKGIKSLSDCLKKCSTAGMGIPASVDDIAQQICYGIDYDFGSHKCYFHVDNAMPPNHLCPADGLPPPVPLNAVPNPSVISILLCPGLPVG